MYIIGRRGLQGESPCLSPPVYPSTYNPTFYMIPDMAGLNRNGRLSHIRFGLALSGNMGGPRPLYVWCGGGGARAH